MFFVDKNDEFSDVFSSQSASDEIKQFTSDIWKLFKQTPQLVIFPQLIGSNLITFYVDFIHLMWRLRSPMLAWNSSLKIGKPFNINVHQLWQNFKQNAKEILNITTQDLDYHNKQSIPACLKLFLFIKTKEGKYVFNDEFARQLRDHYTETWGLHLYANFANRFIGLFLNQDRLPLDMIEDCGYVINFLSAWYQISLAIAENAKNSTDERIQRQNEFNKIFVSKETMQDIIVTCNSIIYLLMFKAAKQSASAIKMSKLSTRFNEYSFSSIRKRFGTNNTVDTESIINALNLLRFDIKYQ